MNGKNRSDPSRAGEADATGALDRPQKTGPVVFHDSLRSPQAFEALNAANRRFDVMPVGGDGVDIDVTGLRNERFGIWRVASRSGFRAAAKAGAEADAIAIGLTTHGRLHCRGQTSRHVAEPGFGLFVPASEIRDIEASTGFEAVTCLLRKDALTDRLNALGDEDPAPALGFETVADLRSLALRGFRHSLVVTLDRLMRVAETGELVDRLIEDILLDQLIGSWPQAPVRRSAVNRGSSRHVQRAIDFIEANLALPLSVADVARAAGIGVRALQSSFRKDLGRTPIQHIIDRRLEQAHDDLRRDEHSPISAIASRWGFTHMSDFSRRYRERFGCTPSETQIRAARRS